MSYTPLSIPKIKFYYQTYSPYERWIVIEKVTVRWKQVYKINENISAFAKKQLPVLGSICGKQNSSALHRSDLQQHRHTELGTLSLHWVGSQARPSF